MSYKNIWYAWLSGNIGLGIAVTGILLNLILPNFNPIGQILIIAIVILVYGFVGSIIYQKYEKEKNEQKPNPEVYFEHLEKIHKSLKEGVEKQDLIDKFIKKERNMPNFFDIITQSEKKTEILQHLVTHFSYPNEEMPKVFQSFYLTHFAKTISRELSDHDEFVNNFNKKFNHIYQILGDSKTLVGLCDGCKRDYFGEDKKDVFMYCIILMKINTT